MIEALRVLKNARCTNTNRIFEMWRQMMYDRYSVGKLKFTSGGKNAVLDAVT